MKTIEKQIYDVNVLFLMMKFWPEWLTFDAFVYFFSRKTGNEISLICADSTAASPFLKSTYLDECVVGIPAKILDTYFLGDRFICNKVKMLERIYRNYSEFGSIERIESCLFKYKSKDKK